MKVSIADFEIHLMAFIKDIANVMPSQIHKFAIGSIVAANLKRIEDMIKLSADKDGMIDVDNAKKIIDAGFAASGDTITINLPSIPLLGLRGVDFNITKTDSDKFFAGFYSINNQGEK